MKRSLALMILLISSKIFLFSQIDSINDIYGDFIEINYDNSTNQLYFTNEILFLNEIDTIDLSLYLPSNFKLIYGEPKMNLNSKSNGEIIRNSFRIEVPNKNSFVIKCSINYKNKGNDNWYASVFYLYGYFEKDSLITVKNLQDISSQLKSIQNDSLIKTFYEIESYEPEYSLIPSLKPSNSKGQITVEGQIKYTDNIGDLRPVRFAKVNIYDSGTSAEIATVATNEFGEYTCSISYDEEDGPDIYIEVYTNGYDNFPLGSNGIVNVSDGLLTPPYYLSSNSNIRWNSTNDLVINLNGSAGGTHYGAFYVFDSFIEGWIRANANFNLLLDKTNVFWPASSTVKYVWIDLITLIQDDRFDRDVILHEYGHYVDNEEDLFDGATGAHSWYKDLRLDYNDDRASQLAMSEGWATFFSIASQYYSTKDSIYDDDVDQTINDNLEINNYKTPYRESATCGILWDLFDNNIEKHDSLCIDLTQIWDIISNGNKLDRIEDVASQWASLNFPDFADLTRIYNFFGVPLHGIDFQPPYIKKILHSDNIETNIELIVSEDLDETTVSQSNIIIQGSKSGFIECNIAYVADQYKIVITPNVPFQYSEIVTVSITTNVKDIVGNSIDGNGDGSIGPNYIHTFNIQELIYTHDYAISPVAISDNSPTDGDLITLTAVVTNQGQNTEPENQRVHFYDNGVLQPNYATLPALAPGAQHAVQIYWTADEGGHNLTLKCSLTGDENPENDENSVAVNVGTEGVLEIDGETSTARSLKLSPGNNIVLPFQLSNIGTAPVNINVTRAGEIANWITLLDGTSLSIDRASSTNYEIQIIVPSSLTYRTYTGTVTFNCDNGNSASVFISIQVTQNVSEGPYTKTLNSGSVLIDGTQSGSSTIITFLPAANYLDNNPATSYPDEIISYFTCDQGVYNRMNSSSWIIHADELQAGSMNSRLSLNIDEGNGLRIIDSYEDESMNILGWWCTGLNSITMELDYYAHDAADVSWRIYQSSVTYALSTAAWGGYCTIEGDVEKMRDGLDYARIYFTVNDVARAGDLILTRSGHGGIISTKSIDSGDEGDELYFTLTSSEFETSNYYAIKGDPTDDTRATISNIRLEIGYFTGNPNLNALKSLSTTNASVNENITVDLSFQNVGSNIADRVQYNDSPLPVGIALISGSLSATADDVRPGETGSESYIIRPTIPGNYVFGATTVAYEDFSDNEYSTTFNPVSLSVQGSLSVTAEVTPAEIFMDESSTVEAVVVDNNTSGVITDATVLCEIYEPGSSILVSSFYLIYNTVNQSYIGTISDLPQGSYDIYVKAERDYYHEQSSSIITFTVNGPPVLTISTSNIDLGWESASSGSFEIYSNVSWTVSIPEAIDWLSISPLSGAGDGTISISATSANTTGIIRSAIIAVSGVGVNSFVVIVNQDREPYLVISPPSILFDASIGSETLTVSSNTTWNVSVDASWLTVSQTSGSNNGIVTVSATSPNTTGVSRSAAITFTGTGVSSQPVTGTQLNVSYLTVTTSSIVLDSDANSSANFNISSNTSWNISSTASWLAISPINGSNYGGVTITAITSNTTGIARSAIVNITGDGVDPDSVIVVQNAESHFTPPTGGYDFMNLYVLDAVLDDVNMQPGDEIGVFDEGVCVGAGKLTEILNGSNYLDIKVPRDDPDTPEKEGYEVGNPIQYRAWDASEQVEVISCGVEYLSGEGIYSVSGSASLNLNFCTSVDQIIDLLAGWNIISFYVEPEYMSMDSLFRDLKNADILSKVQDETGSAMEELPPPIGWINNIIDMSPTEGYKTKVTEDVMLTITGKLVELPLNIPLLEGWNIMGYPCQHAQSSDPVYDDLRTEGTLLKVQDEAGNAIEELPVPIGWINNIVTLVPGEGYKIKVSSETDVVISAPFTKVSLRQRPTVKLPEHFTPAWEGNGLDHMNIYIIPGEGLDPGDEIGIFDGEICVGSAVVSIMDYISIPVSWDDPETVSKDGYEVGNAISLRIWKSDNNNEYQVKNIDFSENSNSFYEKMETSIIYLDMSVLLEDEASFVNHTSLADAFPNPFNRESTICFELGHTVNVRIEIFNLLGEKVCTLVDQVLKSGSHQVVWNSSNDIGESVGAGVYIYRITTKDLTLSKYIIHMNR